MNAKQIITLLILGAVLAACQFKKQDTAEPPHEFNKPSTNVLTGGQPSQADLVNLKKTGVTKVINLRDPSEEPSRNEKAEVEALGLTYVSLPINGAADITSENARKLDALLKGNESVLLHCSSGNRVGALMAIRAHEIEGKSADEALQIGRSAGLGSLEEKVKSVLNDNPSKTH